MPQPVITVQDTMWAGTQVSFLAYLDRLGTVAEREANGIKPEAFLTVSHSTPTKQDEPLPYLLSIDENVAVIEIRGPMSNQTHYYDKWDKTASYPAIRDALVKAAQMDEVTQILLDIDSGGGSVSGVADVGSLIREINGIKPVTAFTDGNMMSAAYWLGAAAGKVYMTKAAGVGSIGVIATHMEVSKMYEEMGIKATVMRSGKYKALANRFEPLTDAAKEQMQSGLDAAYGVFVQHVADMRKKSYATVDSTMAQGKEFYGEAALSVGLVDGMTTYDKLMSKLKTKTVDSQKSFSQNPNQIHKGNVSMSKSALTSQQIAALAASGVVVQANVPAPEATDPADTTAEVTENEGTEGEDTTENQAENAGGREDKPNNDGVKPEAAAEAGLVAFLQAQVADKDKSLLANGVELAQLRARVADMEAAQSGLVAIAAKSVNNMRIALGGTAIDLSAMGATALLAEHKSFEDQFNKKFVAGGIAAVDAAQEKKTVAQVDSLQAARLSAVTVRNTTKR